MALLSFSLKSPSTRAGTLCCGLICNGVWNAAVIYYKWWCNLTWNGGLPSGNPVSCVLPSSGPRVWPHTQSPGPRRSSGRCGREPTIWGRKLWRAFWKFGGGDKTKMLLGENLSAWLCRAEWALLSKADNRHYYINLLPTTYLSKIAAGPVQNPHNIFWKTR